MLQRPLTIDEQQAVSTAALAVLKAYDMAGLDPQVKIPSYLHAAVLVLRKSMEKK